MADVDETGGGSRQLLKILNRLGCVSSPDTHDRFVSMHANDNRERNVWTVLSLTAFTVASVDNFDILQSHAAVHSGNQHQRSYHGTTVQLVQPAVSHSLLHSQVSETSNSTNNSTEVLTDRDSRRRPVAQSPSPHKLGKTGPKRPRTVAVSQLQSRLAYPVQETSLSNNPYQYFTISDFQLSTEEIDSLSDMKLILFNFMLMKHSFKGETSCLSDMCKFFKQHQLLEDVYLPTREMAQDFFKFIKEPGEIDSTWKFWGDFVFRNCFAYITLFLSLRGCNWTLHTASLKEMTPVFAAFDCEVYGRIIPNHLADLLYPTEILLSLSSGGFTVHITGEPWRAVALDEAHEMCINKDLKTAITYPTEAYLQKTSLFMNCQVKLTNNFVNQLFPEKDSVHVEQTTIIDNSSEAVKCEKDIVKMTETITEVGLLPSNSMEDRGIVNTFNGQVATIEQQHDLLTFRAVGEEATEKCITHQILRKSFTATTTIRQKKLLTMSASSQSKRSLTKREKMNK